MDSKRYVYEDALWAKTRNILQKKNNSYVECQLLGGIQLDEIEAIGVSSRFKSEIDTLVMKHPGVKVEYVDEAQV